MSADFSSANPPDGRRDRPGETPASRESGTWNPQRSLVARLLWYVVPVALVPAAVYWAIGDRIAARQRESLLATLAIDARRHEARTLSEDAAERVRAIGNLEAEVISIVRRCAEESRRALEAGPDPGLPAEALVNEPGGLLRSRDRGVSAAIVSREHGLDPEARRDLAATRRLEAPFVVLGVGPVDLSALWIRTASGVLRIVPGLDVKPGGKPIVDPGFRFPSALAATLADGTGGTGSTDVVWSPVYEDTYAGNGEIVSALALVKGRDGRLLAEVGVDWVFPRIFQGSQDPTRPDDVEFVFAADGRAVVVVPENRFDAERIRELGASASKLGNGTFDVRIGEQTFLVAARHVPQLGWTYVIVAPRAALEKKVLEQLHPIFARESPQARRAARLLRRPRRAVRRGGRRGDAPGPRAAAPRGTRHRGCRGVGAVVAPPAGERPGRRDRPAFPGR